MSLKPRFQLLLATSNAGKIRELQEALHELPITLRHLAEFPDVLTVEETGNSYEENAILKALSYSAQTGLCALADDSGLEVDALGGMPGVLSARSGGEHALDQDRTEKVLRMLSSYQGSARAARFVCCMAFAGWPLTDSEPQVIAPQVLNVSEGLCEGLLAMEPRGTFGFGYDPIFVPSGYTDTFGELTGEVKRSLSHRGKALSAMRMFLSQFLTVA